MTDMTNKKSNGNNGKPRVLTVFYSHSGNTRTLARLIQQLAGGDLVELLPITPYPEDYDTVVDQARRELQAGYKPPLKTSIEDIATSDLILVGSPNW